MAVTTIPTATTTSSDTDRSSPPAPRDTRTRLVLAAAELVHAESYHSVGVKAICERAQVRRGSFYHFFESKQALMLEALEIAWQEFDDDVLASCRDETLTPRRRIEAVVGSIHARQVRDQERTGHVLGCTFGNLAAEATTLDDVIRLRLVQVFDDWTEALEAPLAEAQLAGDIDQCLTPRAAASEVLAALQGVIVLAKTRNDPEIIAVGGPAITARLWGCSHEDRGKPRRTSP